MRKVLLIAMLLLAAGCGSEEDGSRNSGGEARGETVERPLLDVKRPCGPGEERTVGDQRLAYAVSVRERTVAYEVPGGASVASFGKINQNGVAMVFGVLGVVLDESCEPVWYQVQLPIRPNGATGYVHAADVFVHQVQTRIEIDLSDRTVELLRDGRRVMRVVAAIGSEATPTPTGRYYVNQRLRAEDPTGPFGPGALGISAFSPVLTGWAQGGPIAIHGTNEPWSVGEAVSNGCLRVPNDTLERLYDATPAGTPVVIRA